MAQAAAIISTEDDALFVVGKIRDGTLQGESKEAAFAALEAFQKKTAVKEPEEKKSFAQRFGEDLHARGELFETIIEEELVRDNDLLSSYLQVIGKIGASVVLDFLGEAIVSGGRGLSAITPDFIEDPAKRNAAKAGVLLLNTKVGRAGLRAGMAGIESYKEFAKEHTSVARNIEAVVNIALLAAPVKAKPVRAPLEIVGPVRKIPRTGGPLTRAGAALERSGLKSAAKRKIRFVIDLVTPKQTAKARQAQVARTTEEGALQTARVELTAAQDASAKEILKLAVSPKKTIQGNFNVIRQHVFKLADDLKIELAKTGKAGKFNKEEFFAQLDATLVRLQENPALVGNAEISAERIIKIMRAEVEREAPHVSNLLAARKAFDQKLIQEGREKLFDPALENAMTFAIREIRKTTNNFIQQRVPSVGVRRSLDTQSKLLRAMDDIKIKAADEANSAITRTLRKGIKVLTARGEINQIAALVFGVGGLGAAAMFAPFIRNFGALGVVVYVGGRLIMRPGARKGLGRLLKTIDEMTLKISDPAVLKELRVDRALIVELLEMSDKELTETEGE